MKSILEEASTIMKAIEKGWIQAGKPREFSVKVLEEPVKNFIGMTTKSAKIGFFFDEKAVARKDGRESRPQQQHHPRKEHETRETHKQAPHHKQQPRAAAPQPSTSAQHTDAKKEQRKPAVEPRPRNIWTDDLVAHADSWLTECLRRIDKEHIQFTATPKQAQLIITFKSPIVDDEMKQRTFFRSSSYLLMQSLRSQSKKSLRGLTILLTNA